MDLFGNMIIFNVFGDFVSRPLEEETVPTGGGVIQIIKSDISSR